MKNAFIKDSLRQVGVTINRFIAILSVTALGVAFFAGLKATAPDMRVTAQSYFEGLNFMDISLLSTAGFTGGDIDAVRAVAGVKTAMPAYSADAIVNMSEKSLTVKLLSLDLAALQKDPASVINRPKLVSGRMPENENEILADPRYLTLSGYKVGDRVTFRSGTGDDILSTLKKATFTIVGVAQDPLYISYERGSSTVGNGRVDAYFILPTGAFSLPVYTDVYLTVDNAAGLTRFDGGYDSLIKPVTAALGDISGQREALRYDQIKSEGQTKLDNAKVQLASGEKALSDAEKQLDDAQAQIDAGEAQLAQGRQTYNSQISAGEAKLAASQAKYNSGEGEYQTNLASYNQGLKKYNDGVAQLAAAERQAGTANLTDAQVQAMISGLKLLQAPLQPSSAQYQTYQQSIDGLTQILQARTVLPAQKTKLKQARAALDSAAATLASSKAQLDAGRSQLNTQRAAGEKQLGDSAATLASSKARLAAGRAAYAAQAAAAQPGLDSARAAIADGEKQLAAVNKPVWYVLDHNTNPGFAGFKQDADRISALANVFPLIFFLVAALVSLTTMTRLVEDDRSYIGTMKALGYGRGTIAAKYLVYALAASLIGSVMGLFIGFNLFPRVVFNAYGILYTLPKVTAQFNIPYALISTAAAVLCAALPAVVVCVSSLRGQPAELMRPKVPPAGRRILLERITPLWKRMNFSQKVSARNLLRYKKRLIMTIVGVAGCTALIFTGFGLRDAISTIVGKQYEDIRTYDMEVDTRPNASADTKTELSDYLSTRVTGSAKVSQQSVDALKGGSVKSVYLVVPQTDTTLDGYVDLRERVGHRPLTLGGDKVIITEKLASVYSLKKGDSFKIRDSDGVTKSVTVGGITENYLFHYIYMPPELYTKLFGKPVTANQLLCKLPDKAKGYEDTISKGLMKLGAVSSVAFTTNLKENFQKMIGALRYVVLVLILSAAALAFVVLFSLTSINIDERNRELATIKVLGFYNGELAAYIYRENVVLTVASSLIGLILGIFMQRYVILTAEVDLVMFSRDILWQTYLYSAGLTVLFAAFVNAIMFVRFKKIDMVSSLKSVE